MEMPDGRRRSVYKDKMMIWNAGQLPEKSTIETLLAKHSLNLQGYINLF